MILASGFRVSAVGEVLRGSRNPDTRLLYSCLCVQDQVSAVSSHNMAEPS